MKIAIVYGSPRKGITFECVNIVKREMNKNSDVEFEEVFLPQDAPCFCHGCFTCFSYGEDKCPNAQYIQPIVKKLEGADGIIISSPVYVMQVSGGLKTLFDHLAYCYLNHKPRFFRQKALVIVTTAGAGASGCSKYIKTNLSFWGITKVISFAKALNAAKWDEMPVKIKVNAINSLKKKANDFYNEVASKKIYKPNFIQSIMFSISRVFASKMETTNSDRIYWDKKGWLNDNTDYYIKEVKPNIFVKTLGRIISKMLFKS